MNIRCERCSTMYELDEKLLAPEGSPVQCTKCQHVFTAVPPRSAGRTLLGVPAAPPPAPVAPRPPPAAPRPSGAGEGQGTGGRQGPTIYKPTQPSSATRSPRPRRDTMGTFEARLRKNARLRWIVPLAVLGMAIVAVAGWFLIARRVDPVAQRQHAEAMALVAQDDVASLEKAGQILDDLSGLRTGIETVEADHCLARLLLATGLQEDVSAQAERLARKMAERDRLAAVQPPPEGLAALSAEVEALRVQVEPRQAKAKALVERAYAQLKAISAQRSGDPAVARALAIYSASVGDREQALRFIRASAGAPERDPWIRLAEAWLDVREPAKEPRERGVAKLTAMISAHPEIVRARFLLATAQAGLGRREQAAATLDGLIAANPGHIRAKRLRDELVVPILTAPVPPPAPGARPAPTPVGGGGQGAPAAPRLVGPLPSTKSTSTPRPLPAPGVPPPPLSPAGAQPPGTAPGVPPGAVTPAPGTGGTAAPPGAPKAPPAAGSGTAQPVAGSHPAGGAPAAPTVRPAVQPQAAPAPASPRVAPAATPAPAAAAPASPAPAPAASPAP